MPHMPEATSQLILTTPRLLATQELAQDVAPRNKVIHLLRSRTTLLDDLAETLKLLAGVLLVLAQLLRYLDIVQRVLVLQALDGLLDLIDQVTEAARRDVLADKFLQAGDGTSLRVELAINKTVGTSLRVHECNEGLLRARALVVLGFLGALGEKLDGGVAGDTLLSGKRFCVLGFGINLGDDNVGLEDKVISDRFPGRSEALAV